MKRRKFLVTTAAVSGTVSCSRQVNSWRFFTDAEGRTLEALVDQIIPPDQDPGGTQAGVANYIDRQLIGHFREHQAFYRAGLAALERTALTSGGKSFSALSPAERQSVLEALDQGKAPEEIWKPHSAQQFFRMVVDHSMQGFYGDPRHGGNRDCASWQMLGVATPPVRGRDQYDFTQIPRVPKGGVS